MTRWAAFAGITLALTSLLLALARLSQSAVSPQRSHADHPHGAEHPDGADHLDALDGTGTPDSTTESMPSSVLLLNVALSQGVFGLLLLAGAWYTRVPTRALGVGPGPLSTGLPALGVGVAVGVVLYLGNELASRVADARGIEHAEELRRLLAPDSPRGWALLLGVALPVVALVEELLFRAALVGALSVGFAISPWLLAAVSSAAFAVAHGAQGSAGIVVAGALGLALAATFVLTNSLLAVVVAHYLVNALEFAVNEH